jgi:hypothetical protein
MLSNDETPAIWPESLMAYAVECMPKKVPNAGVEPSGELQQA